MNLRLLALRSLRNLASPASVESFRVRRMVPTTVTAPYLTSVETSKTDPTSEAKVAPSPTVTAPYSPFSDQVNSTVPIAKKPEAGVDVETSAMVAPSPTVTAPYSTVTAPYSTVTAPYSTVTPSLASPFPDQTVHIAKKPDHSGFLAVNAFSIAAKMILPSVVNISLDEGLYGSGLLMDST